MTVVLDYCGFTKEIEMQCTPSGHPQRYQEVARYKPLLPSAYDFNSPIAEIKVERMRFAFREIKDGKAYYRYID